MTLPRPMPRSNELSPKDDAHTSFLEDLQEQVEQHKLAIADGHVLCQVRASAEKPPATGERSGRAPAASQAVLQSIQVPAEVSTGSVDGLTDRAVEGIPVNDVSAVQGEHLACRRIGLPPALVLPGPQGHRQPCVSVIGREFVPHSGAVQVTGADQLPRSFSSGQGVLAPERHREVDEVGTAGGALDVDDGDLVDDARRAVLERCRAGSTGPCLSQTSSTTTQVVGIG